MTNPSQEHAFLGHLVLFTVTDEPIFTYSSLEKLVTDVGIEPRFLPLSNTYFNAFKKALSDTANMTYSLAGGRSARVLCRQISNARDQVVSQVTREVEDGHRRRPTGAGRIYEEIVHLRFFKPSDPHVQSTARLLITVNPDHLVAGELPDVQRIARQIKDSYERYYDFLDGQKVRKVVRAYLRHLNAIEIRGGVYFIDTSRDRELSRLVELVNRLGGGCHMDQIPVVDLEGPRAFIARAFEAEARQSLQDLDRDIRELAASRTSITPTAFSKMRRRYNQVVDQTTEHLLTLKIPADSTVAAAENALRSLGELEERMHTPEGTHDDRTATPPPHPGGGG